MTEINSATDNPVSFLITLFLCKILLGLFNLFLLKNYLHRRQKSNNWFQTITTFGYDSNLSSLVHVCISACECVLAKETICAHS